MARSNVARRHGDDFQARLFWLYAASLLDPHSAIIKVAYETGPKGFDDILVEYDPKAAPQDHEAKPIYLRHLQCKWHTTAGAFGYEDLIDPAFIGAERYSLLERVYQAQSRYAADGFGCRFELVTNWRLKPEDALIGLVRKESDALDLDRLFDGSTDRSRVGKIRKLWCEHLGLDYTNLRLVARVLAIVEMSESLARLRERLDEKFAAVGMKRVPAAETCFLYDDLAAKLLAQRRVEFDRRSFHDMAVRERLLEPPGKRMDALVIGIRSFMHPIDPLENRCDRMLNLVPYFEGRYIRNQSDWQDRILPELRMFALEAAHSTNHLQVILDAHASLAFALGALLNVKSGKRIDIEQRTGGRRFWAMDDQAPGADWPTFDFEEEIIHGGFRETALAIGLTHDISSAVRGFVKSQAPVIGRIIHCRPQGGSSQQIVRGGAHAWMLAESVVRQIRSLHDSGAGVGPLHVFFAGPNAFTFFLGQHQQALGPTAVYEWDFDGQRGGGYSLGMLVGSHAR